MRGPRAQFASLTPNETSTAKTTHHGTTPSAIAPAIRGAFSPTAKAITAVACGPMVTGASKQSPSNPPRRQILQTNFVSSLSTGILNFRTSHPRRGAPATKIAAPPAT